MTEKCPECGGLADEQFTELSDNGFDSFYVRIMECCDCGNQFSVLIEDEFEGTEDVD